MLTSHRNVATRYRAPKGQGKEIVVKNLEELAKELWENPEVQYLAIEVAQQELYPPKFRKWGWFLLLLPQVLIGALIGRATVALSKQARKKRLNDAIVRHISLDAPSHLADAAAVADILVGFSKVRINEYIGLLEHASKQNWTTH